MFAVPRRRLELLSFMIIHVLNGRRAALAQPPRVRRLLHSDADGRGRLVTTRAEPLIDVGESHPISVNGGETDAHFVGIAELI